MGLNFITYLNKYGVCICDQAGVVVIICFEQNLLARLIQIKNEIKRLHDESKDILSAAEDLLSRADNDLSVRKCFSLLCHCTFSYLIHAVVVESWKMGNLMCIQQLYIKCVSGWEGSRDFT